MHITYEWQLLTIDCGDDIVLEQVVHFFRFS